MNPNGVVIYEGPSQLNGDPIVAILTGLVNPSNNSKTGPMLQLWILSQKDFPNNVARNGDDTSVCGDCPLRPSLKGGVSCYVDLYRGGPGQVWKQWKAMKYDYASIEILEWIGFNQSIRLGAYGDPTAIPISILNRLIVNAKNWTGYTHQWKNRDIPYIQAYRHILMASVETLGDRAQAQSWGWRTFRVSNIPNMMGEISCPASEEAGYRTQCVKCGLCNGKQGSGDQRKNITIRPH